MLVSDFQYRSSMLRELYTSNTTDKCTGAAPTLAPFLVFSTEARDSEGP